MKSIIIFVNLTLFSLLVLKPAEAQDWNKESGYNVIMNYWNWFPDYLIGKTIYPITTNGSTKYGFQLQKSPTGYDYNYQKRGDYSSSYELVIEKRFKITSVVKAEIISGYKSKVYRLEDDQGVVSYLNENNLLSFNIDSLSLDDVDVCELVEVNEDKFTKRITASSPATTSNGVAPAWITIIKDESGSTAVFLSTRKRIDSYGKGVYLLLEDGTVISDEEKEVEISVLGNSYDDNVWYEYDAMILLDSTETRFVVNNPITEYRLGNVDTEVDFPEFWSEILRCMNN